MEREGDPLIVPQVGVHVQTHNNTEGEELVHGCGGGGLGMTNGYGERESPLVGSEKVALHRPTRRTKGWDLMSTRRCFCVR